MRGPYHWPRSCDTLGVRITYDRERDIAWIELEDVRKSHPQGGSHMMLPPYFPFEIHIHYDGPKDERHLTSIRVPNASKRLHPDALAHAVPWKPLA